MYQPLIKKLIIFCLIFLIIPVPSASAQSIIPDPVLAEAIRSELKLASGKEIKQSDLKKLESLYLEESKEKIIRLQGIEYATNMVSLFLPGQNIKDISSISKLTKLSFLALSGNQIADLTPLSGLKFMEQLVVDGNKIQSLAPLKNLHNLTDLIASDNQITDLSPIKKLPLQWLILENNNIKDLTPLKNHPNLEYLYLSNNHIQDIQVLETIPNLQEVSLSNNPLNQQALKIIDNLRADGVEVEYGKSNEAGNTTPSIEIKLDLDLVSFNVKPFIKNGSVMVPFRPLFERLGLQVTWIKNEQVIIGEKEGTKIKLKVGDQNAEVNGKTTSLSVAPTIVSGNTFVPLRFIAESLDAKVEWDDTVKSAVIQSKQQIVSSDGSLEVTVYGRWKVINDVAKYEKLAIEDYSWTSLVVKEVPKVDLAPNTSLDDFYQSAKKEMDKGLGIEVLEETNQMFQGQKAKRMLYYNLEEEYFIYEAIFFELDGHFYQITLSRIESLPEKYWDELEDMVNSLKFNPR